MSLYVNYDHLIEYLLGVRNNRDVNKSPYMDSALWNVQRLLERDIRNFILFDCVEIGDCDNCRWKNRKQKCSCCRRNRYIKDCYEEKQKSK